MNRMKISNMLNGQFKKWNSHKKKKKVITDTLEPAEMPMHSIVTLSRQMGSGGEFIGYQTAKKLGFKHYDKKLVDEIANKAQMRKTQVESLDERSRNFIEECYRAIMMDSHFLTSSSYFKHLSEVVLSIAQHGKAVIVGRGANFVLGDKTGLRVRIVSSLQKRIKRVVKKRGISEKKALEIIKRDDSQKKQFIQTHFGQDIEVCTNFDLIINTDEITLDEAVDLIVWLERRKMHEKKNHGRPGYC